MDPTREQRLARIVASLRGGDVVTYRDAYGDEMTGRVRRVGDRMMYVWATKDGIRGYDGKPDEDIVDILAVTRNATEIDLDAFGLTTEG